VAIARQKNLATTAVLLDRLLLRLLLLLLLLLPLLTDLEWFWGVGG
jgi:hypothetical protein